MKKEIADKWVAALLSGKFPHGQGKLFNDGSNHAKDGRPGFCCLGVLCEISGIPYDKNSSYLPAEVANWAGMSNSRGTAINYDGTLKVNLPYLNDKGNKSFTDIAEVIIRHWQEL